MKKDTKITFDHIGVPTKESQEGEFYIEDGKCWATDSTKTKFNIEFLRPEDGCPYPPEILARPHVSYLVENLDEALEGENVIVEPFQPIPTRRLAFIDFGGMLIELAEEVKE
jgi:hypothetical protein